MKSRLENIIISIEYEQKKKRKEYDVEGVFGRSERVQKLLNWRQSHSR